VKMEQSVAQRWPYRGSHFRLSHNRKSRRFPRRSALLSTADIVTLPGTDEQFMFYPTRAQFDPGSVWLRNLLLQTGRGLDRPKRRAL